MTIYFIAEAGVNHDGDIEKALALVDVAADAKADAVKFQTFVPDELVGHATRKAAYQMAVTDAAESQLDMLRRLALRPEDYRRLRDRCMERQIDFMSTPFDADSADFLVDELGMAVVKVASGEIVNGPLLLHLARKKRKIFLSTGMSTLPEINDALRIIAHGLMDADGRPDGRAYHSPAGKAALARTVVLLQCTSEYPAPLHTVNLFAMETLRDEFGLPVGYSDHSLGFAAPLAAVGLGASVIEKHITLDCGLSGPDHAASLEPAPLAELVHLIRQASIALGDRVKAPSAAERATAQVARRVLVAGKPIAQGERFDQTNLVARRAPGALSPMRYWDALDRTASHAYATGDAIDEIL